MTGLPTCNTMRDRIYTQRVRSARTAGGRYRPIVPSVHYPPFDVEEDDAGNFIKRTL